MHYARVYKYRFRHDNVIVIHSPPIRAPVRCIGYGVFCMVDNKPLLRQQTDLIRFRQNLNLSLQVGLRKYSSFLSAHIKIVFSAKRATDYTVEIITHLLLARHQKIGRRRELDVTLKSSWMRRATRLLFNRDAVIDNFPVDVRSNSTPSFVQIIFPHLSWLWQVVFVNPLALWHSRFTPAPCLTGWPSPNDSTHDQSLTSRFYDSKKWYTIQCIILYGKLSNHQLQPAEAQ